MVPQPDKRPSRQHINAALARSVGGHVSRPVAAGGTRATILRGSGHEKIASTMGTGFDADKQQLLLANLAVVRIRHERSGQQWVGVIEIPGIPQHRRARSQASHYCHGESLATMVSYEKYASPAAAEASMREIIRLLRQHPPLAI